MLCYAMLCHAIRSDPKPTPTPTPTLSDPILQVQVRSDQMAARDELSSSYHSMPYHIVSVHVISYPILTYPALS